MSDLEEEYRLEYFEQEGLERKQCPDCGDHFWTRDPDRTRCGEPPCEPYSFIDNPGFDRAHTLEEMREAFLSFFADHGHERIEPYPVAANRWRDDVLLTQASIYDFQPLVTSGKTPPPANPLTISQPCIRMQDIDNVGKTGRHTMAFEMMAHHAFNAREDADEEYAYEGEVYWKSQTVAYCDELMEEMGADLEEVTYIEDPWVGGGNAGPAIEVIYRGLELATLVFMSMEQDPDGEYELKDGNRYTPMDTYIVDTGYGLERWTWMSQGTPTVYEAIYPEMIAFLRDNAGLEYTDEEDAIVHNAARLAGTLDIDDVEDVEAARGDIAAELDVDVDRLRELVEPLETVYAIADHARTLAYMLGDEIVPSNVGTGYLVRMVLRRTKRLADSVGVDAPIDELVDMQAERLGYTNRDTIRDIVRHEIQKYRETLERGRRRVRDLTATYAASDDAFPTEDLLELYDSHGIQPETVAEIAAEQDVAVTIPDDFYRLVTQRHDQGGKNTTSAETATADWLGDFPETDQLYYEDQRGTEFEAVILATREAEDGYDVVLDQTMFYPEGGGQPPDHGTLRTDDRTVSVTDVQIEDGVIRHRVDGQLENGDLVRGSIDADRRRQLMRNHTATHIVLHSARQVLGGHVRQAGAQKGVETSRLDVSHYQRISDEQLRAIERTANELVRDNQRVLISWEDRNEAENTHGFTLYQGGIPPGEQIRVVQVDADVQACGGTHVSRTGKIGMVKLRSTERVQDGVERLTYSAGPAAIAATQEIEAALTDAASTFDVDPLAVPATAERFFEEWKDRGKRIEELKEELATARATGGEDGDRTTVGDATVVVRRLDTDIDELRATANAIVESGAVAILGSGADGAQFVVATPEESEINAGRVVERLATMVDGGGGGPPDFAQGGGPATDDLDAALEAAPEILQRIHNV